MSDIPLPRGRIRLSPRQLEVLELLCEGLPNKVIAARLAIAEGTVKAHVAVILRELGASSRLQAVVAARRCGLPAQRASRAFSAAPASEGVSITVTPADSSAERLDA